MTGLVLRAWVLTSPLSVLDGDEAIVGLMALRALDGDVPVFYWGGLYGGSQEALLTALVFAATGAGTLALKLVSLAIYALAAFLLWLVGRRTVGEPAARLSVVLFAIWPPFLVWWSTKARAFYGSGLVVGLAAVLLALRLCERESRRDAVLLGAVLGFGVWVTLQSFLLALPALAWLAWRRPRAYRLAVYALPGFVVGAGPWLAWNVRYGWNALLPGSVAGAETTYQERLVDFFTLVLPMWLGLRAPYSHDWLIAPAVGASLLVIALAAFVFVLVRRSQRLEPVLVIGAAYPFLYAASSFTYFVEEPRYLVFLAPVPALLLGSALGRYGPAVATLALASLLAVSVAGLTRLERQGLYRPLADGARLPNDLDPLLDALEREHADRVLANYWIAYRITFESDRRLVATSTGFVRDQHDDRLVRSSAAPARVFVAGSPVERAQRRVLTLRGYRRVVAGEFAVFVPRR